MAEEKLIAPEKEQIKAIEATSKEPEEITELEVKERAHGSGGK